MRIVTSVLEYLQKRGGRKFRASDRDKVEAGTMLSQVSQVELVKYLYLIASLLY